MLGYHGINSAGVGKFENALGGGPRSRFALPHYPVERMMYECENLEQVLDLLRRMPAEYNVNFILCDGEGNIADAEYTTEGPQILRDQGAGYLVHTSHYLCQRFATDENFKRSLADSFPRLDRINSLIKARYGSLEVDDYNGRGDLANAVGRSRTTAGRAWAAARFIACAWRPHHRANSLPERTRTEALRATPYADL